MNQSEVADPLKLPKMPEKDHNFNYTYLQNAEEQK